MGLDTCEYRPTERMRETCEEVAEIVSGSRNTNYGDPSDNHTRTAILWNAYLNMTEHRALSARDVCWMMCLVKMSRDENSRIHDNAVDIAGYAINADIC